MAVIPPILNKAKGLILTYFKGVISQVPNDATTLNILSKKSNKLSILLLN